jgi:hypothetical protein
MTSVACVVGPNVNLLQNKEIMLELNGKVSVTTFSTDFSFQNLVF